MVYQLKIQTDLPLEIEGNNVHVIVLTQSNVALVRRKYFEAYQRAETSLLPKRTFPERFAMIAHEGNLISFLTTLKEMGVRFQYSRFDSGGFRTYSDFANFNEEPRYNWRRWGKE